MKYQAILFDLDETLYAEVDYVRSGFAQVAERIAALADADFGQVLTFMEAELARVGRGRVFDAALSHFGLEASAELVSELVELYRSHEPYIRLFDDADGLLTRLQGKVQLGLVTDGLPQMQWAKIRALELDERMAAIVCTWEHDLPKPDPGGFRLAMERLGTQAEQTLIIGDRPDHDLAAAQALGCDAVRIRRGRFVDVASAPWKALLEVENLETLWDWLQ